MNDMIWIVTIGAVLLALFLVSRNFRNRLSFWVTLGLPATCFVLASSSQGGSLLTGLGLIGVGAHVLFWRNVWIDFFQRYFGVIIPFYRNYRNARAVVLAIGALVVVVGILSASFDPDVLYRRE